jgi:cystathionine beta-lyase
MWTQYQWAVTPEHLVFLPGLVCGLNVAARAVCQPESGILIQTPVYPPFISAPANHGLKLDIAELTLHTQAQSLCYSIDLNAFEQTIQAYTRLFMLCNPHNPVGRCFSREELLGLAEICQRHDLIVCADEIHAELLFDDNKHLPIASLAPEIAQRCITLIAPSKTFNIAGLYCGFAIVQNPGLRKQIKRAMDGLIPEVNLLGLTASLAAYSDNGRWRTELLNYLQANRDFLIAYVAEHLPSLRINIPEGTYLAWIDCRDAGISGNAHTFFLKQAKVALNDGVTFGPGGAGFVRLNFGCSRSILVQALEQMRAAMS